MSKYLYGAGVIAAVAATGYGLYSLYKFSKAMNDLGSLKNLDIIGAITSPIIILMKAPDWIIGERRIRKDNWILTCESDWKKNSCKNFDKKKEILLKLSKLELPEFKISELGVNKTLDDLILQRYNCLRSYNELIQEEKMEKRVKVLKSFVDITATSQNETIKQTRKEFIDILQQHDTKNSLK